MSIHHLNTGSHFDLFTKHFYDTFGDGFDEYHLCWVFNLLKILTPDEMDKDLYTQHFPSTEILKKVTNLTDEQVEFLENN